LPWGEETQQLSGPWRPAAYPDAPPRSAPPAHQQPHHQPHYQPPRPHRPGPVYRSAPVEQYPPGHQQPPPNYPPAAPPARPYPNAGPPQPPVAPPRKKRRGLKVVGSIFMALIISIVWYVVKTGVRETFDEDALTPDVLLDYVIITDMPDLVAEADRIADEMAQHSHIARDRVALAYYRLKADPPASPPKLMVAEAVGRVDVKQVRAEFANSATAEGMAAVQDYSADVPDGKIWCTTGTVEKVPMSGCQWASTSHYVEVVFITGTLEEHRALFVQIRAALATK